MVRTHIANHGMNQNPHDDAGTLNNLQATIDLLNKKIAQMEKDLADRNTALQRQEDVVRTIPDDGGARNSQASGQCKEKENQDDYGGTGERNEHEEGGP
jgi:flagellar hook-associated protein FlgK